MQLLSLSNKITLCLLLLFALTGCDANEAWCFTTDKNAYSNSSTITNVTSTSVTVNADGTTPSNVGANGAAVLNQWVSSGVTVLTGDTVSLAATGTILVSTPYGLSSSVASGNNISSYNGDPSKASQMAAYNAMLAGQSTTSYYDNGGLGTKFILQANDKNSTLVAIPGTNTGFPFTKTQNITVTTKDCGVGDTSSAEPTKWTWNNNWRYTTVRCDNKGHSRSFTATDDPTNPQCKAIHECNSNAPIINKKYTGWLCYTNQTVYQSFDPAVEDTCSSSSFNCENSSTSSGSCYTPTGYFRTDGNDFCNGSNRDGRNITVSNTHPSCSWNDSTANVTTPSLNSCGITDTCWNTNGYRLYAIQTNVTGQCPTDANCLHMNQSSVDRGGKSFGAYGGVLNLKIIDPNAANVTSQADVTSTQTKLAANQNTIASLNAANNILVTNLVNQLGIVDNYSGLDCSQVSYLQTTAAGYAAISTINSAGYPNLSTQLTDISNALVTLGNNCNTLTAQVSPSGVYNSTNINSTINIIKSNLTNLSTLATNLPTPVFPVDGTSPSSTDFAAYQSSLVSILSSMTADTNLYNNTIPAITFAANSYLTNKNTSAGAKTTINNIVIALGNLQLLINNADTNLSNYANDCYNKQISISYVDPLDDTYEPDGVTLVPPSWSNSLTSISSSITSLTTSINSLDSTVSAYKSSLTTLVNGLNAAISSIKSTFGDPTAVQNVNITTTNYGNITTNNAAINNLSNIDDGYTQILANANASGDSGAIGGYTVYVKSDPILASAGTYLNAVITNGDPNVSGTVTTDLGVIDGEPQHNNNVMTESGTIWFKITDPDGNYTNNMGSYVASVGQTTLVNSFGALFGDIIKEVAKQIDIASQNIFANIGCASTSATTFTCSDYISIIHRLLNLYVIVFGLMFLFGLIKTDYVDFLIRIVKISFIIILIKPNSFIFFNQYLFSAFLKFSGTLIAYATGAPASNPFAFLNQSLAIMMFDPITYFKIISLMFQGFLGVVVFIIIIYAAYTFVKAVFQALKVYLMSFIGLGLCFALAPIFIPFALFKITQPLFDNWFKALIRFAMEPVILFIGLIILNAILISILQELFNFSACFKCTFPFGFSIPGVFSIGDATLFCIPWFSPWGVDNVGSGIPFILFMSIPLVITFCMVTKIMEIYSKKLAKEMTMAILGGGTLFGGSKKGPKPMGGNPFEGAQDTMKKLTGSTKSDVQRRSQNNADSLVNRAGSGGGGAGGSGGSGAGGSGGGSSSGPGGSGGAGNTDTGRNNSVPVDNALGNSVTNETDTARASFAKPSSLTELQRKFKEINDGGDERGERINEQAEAARKRSQVRGAKSSSTVSKELDTALTKRRTIADQYTIEGVGTAVSATPTSGGAGSFNPGSISGASGSSLLDSIRDSANRRSALDINKMADDNRAAQARMNISSGIGAELQAKFDKISTSGEVINRQAEAARKDSQTRANQSKILEQVRIRPAISEKKGEAINSQAELARKDSEDGAKQRAQTTLEDEEKMVQRKAAIGQELQDREAVKATLQKIDKHMDGDEELTDEQKQSMRENIDHIRKMNPKYLKNMNPNNLEELYSDKKKKDDE